MAKTVFCLIGAMVGAGFASGREIMHFFSRWGLYSWPLILGAAVLMAVLIHQAMRRDLPNDLPRAGKALLLLLLTAAGGGMTAAAGELTALMLPLHHARTLGALGTLTGCLLFCKKPLGALAMLGRLLLPALTAALIACARIPASDSPPHGVSWGSAAFSCVQAAGYCGLNAALASGVMRDAGAGKSAREKWRISLITGGVFGAMLGLGNATLLPHAGELEREPLPLVVLLRSFGKAGYYTAAFLLYLAVVTTLLAVLRGMISLIPGRRNAAWAGLLAAGTSFLGFQEIVGAAYPALGLLSLGMMLVPPPKMTEETG